MRLTPRNHAEQPAYPKRNARRKLGSKLVRWCGVTVATGAALVSLTLLTPPATTSEVRLAGGWAPSQLEDWMYDSVLPPDRKPPPLAPAVIRDPRKPPPPGGPGHRHLPPPRRTRS